MRNWIMRNIVWNIYNNAPIRKIGENWRNIIHRLFRMGIMNGLNLHEKM